MDMFIQAVGIVGGLMILTAYAMISKGAWNNTSVVYHTVNLAGAGLVAVNTIYNEAYGASFLNLAWCVISTYHLSKRRL